MGDDCSDHTWLFRPSYAIALSRCTDLRRLDLSLILSVDIRILFKMMQGFQSLRILQFPFSVSHGNEIGWGPAYHWPSTIRTLSISGEFDSLHPLFNERFPSELKSLEIGRCPGLSPVAVYRWLKATGENLKHFRVRFWQLSSNQGYLDDVLFFIPAVREVHLNRFCFTAYFWISNFGQEEAERIQERGEHHASFENGTGLISTFRGQDVIITSYYDPIYCNRGWLLIFLYSSRQYNLVGTP